MMNRKILFAALPLVGVAAAPPSAPAPVARYSMDAITDGGMPMMGQREQRRLSLKLWGKGAPASPEATHFIPAGMALGASLPLMDEATSGGVRTYDRMPDGQGMKGRILTYWGCGEKAGAGQPKVTNLAALGMDPKTQAAMKTSMAYAGEDARQPRWPNRRDSRDLAPSASLLGAHKVTSAFTPEIGFALGAGQDFMPALGLRADAALPSGAVPMRWTAAPSATGYYLQYAGAAENGDFIIWMASANGTPGTLDFTSPAEVRKRIAGGTALAPTTSSCILPAEVAKAAPMGAVIMTGYGPWPGFSDKPKAPTWTAQVRFKTDASLMLGMPAMPGMGEMMGNAAPPPGQPQPAKKKKRFGLGDVLKQVSPVPIP